MVKIPEAVSQANLTTQTTAPRISDIGSFTQVAQSLQGAGAAATNIANEFRELDTLRQTSRGLVNGGARLSAAEDSFLNDPELSESSAARFQQEKQNIINDVLSGVSDEGARLRLGVQLEGKALVKTFNIKRQGREADIANYSIEKTSVIDQALLDSIKALPEERPLVREGLVTYLNQNLKLSTKDELKKDLKDFDEDVRTGVAKNVAINEPERFLDEKDEFNLTPDEKEDLVRTANSISTNNAQRAKREVTKIQTETSRDRTLEIYDPNRNDAVLLERLESDFKAGKLTEASFNAKRKSVLSKNKDTAFNDPAVVNPIGVEAIRLASKDVDGLYLNASSEDIKEFEDFFNTIHNAAAEGKITSGRVNEILKPLLPVMEEALDDSAREQVIKENPKSFFQRLAFWADNFAEGDVEKKKADMTAKLFRILGEGTGNIAQATDNIIKEEQAEMHPEWAGLKVGEMMDTVLGSRKIKKILDNGEPDLELLPGDIEALERLRNK